MSTSITCRGRKGKETIRLLFMTIITWGGKKDRDLVFFSTWFLKIGVSAALAVVLAVSIFVSLSVSVLVFGGLRGRTRGQDVIADVIKDAERTRDTEREGASGHAPPACCSVANSPVISFRSSLLIQFTLRNSFSPSAGVKRSLRGAASGHLPLSFFLSFLCRVP